jgi:competence ComEA-like helix-hairpin-helix protein
MALLSILVITLLHGTQIDLHIVKHYNDRIQARYLALAGIEKAKALLFQDAQTRRQDEKNHTGELYDSTQNFQDCSLGNGVFRVFHRGTDENARIVYGITDEASRLNLNTATAAELLKLKDMKPTIVSSVLQWRTPGTAAASGNADPLAPDAGTPPPLPPDPNLSEPSTNEVSGGAGLDYYLSLEPPRVPRMGSFQTSREMLMVQGVSRRLFFAQDYKQNDLIDIADQLEAEKSKSPSDANPSAQALQTDDTSATIKVPKSGASRKSSSKQSDTLLDDENPTDAGWNSLLTVDSTCLNQSASGKDRVNIQTASETDLQAIQGFTQDIAHAIVQYREKKPFHSIADLLDVTAAPAVGGFGQPSSPPANTGNAGDTGNTGEAVISSDLLQQVADEITLVDQPVLQGLVNINTASADVLTCLPGMTPELAQAVVSYRQSTGFFQNIAWLLQVQGMTREIFQQLAPRVTARSETFRILSEGKVLSSGVRQRIQVIVQVTKEDVKTLSYREDL